jgi:hypothetical protein
MVISPLLPRIASPDLVDEIMLEFPDLPKFAKNKPHGVTQFAENSIID